MMKPQITSEKTGKTVGNVIGLVLFILLAAFCLDWLAVHLFGAEPFFYCSAVTWAAESGIGKAIAFCMCLFAFLSFITGAKETAAMLFFGAFTIPLLPSLLAAYVGIACGG